MVLPKVGYGVHGFECGVGKADLVVTHGKSQKDKINELGSACFAAETGQTLTDFYSKDRFGSPDATEKKSRGGTSKASDKHASSEMSPAL